MKNVLNYYSYNKNFVLLEIEVLGDIIDEHDKSVSNHIKVLRIVPVEEYTFDINKTDTENEKYDEKGNKVYQKYSRGNEYFWEYKYDEKGNVIYHKDPRGNEYNITII
jgi:hypothetical protein